MDLDSIFWHHYDLTDAIRASDDNLTGPARPHSIDTRKVGGWKTSIAFAMLRPRVSAGAPVGRLHGTHDDSRQHAARQPLEKPIRLTWPSR